MGALEAIEIVVVDVVVLVTTLVVVAVAVRTAVVVVGAGDVTSELQAELRSVEEKVLSASGVVLEVARRMSSVVAMEV